MAKQVRQVAALQGNVLQKTQAVMILMTVLSLIAATVAVANLMVARSANGPVNWRCSRRSVPPMPQCPADDG